MIKPILKPGEKTNRHEIIKGNLKFPKQGKKPKPGKTKEEKEHLNRVASLGCIIPGCGKAACVHHIRKSGEPRDHFKTIPICYDHHQGGPDGLHFMGKLEWQKIFGDELDFLKQVFERIYQKEYMCHMK